MAATAAATSDSVISVITSSGVTEITSQQTTVAHRWGRGFCESRNVSEFKPGLSDEECGREGLEMSGYKRKNPES